LRRACPPVSGKDVRAADGDFADVARRGFLAVVAQQAHLAFAERAAAGQQPFRVARQGFGMVQGAQQHQAARGFARAIALAQLGPQRFPGFPDARRRHRRAAIRDLPQRAQVVLAQARVRDQHIDHRGHHEAEGGAVPRRGGEEAFRLKTVVQQDRAALEQERLHEHAAGVRNRPGQRQHFAGVGAHAAHHDLAQRGQAVANCLHGGLELARRSGRKVQHGQIVGLHRDVRIAVRGRFQQPFVR